MAGSLFSITGKFRETLKIVILQGFLSSTVWYFEFETVKLSLVFPNCSHIVWQGQWWQGALSEKKQKPKKALQCMELSQAIAACTIHSFTSDLGLEKLSDMQPYKISTIKSLKFQSSVVLDNEFFTEVWGDSRHSDLSKM